MSAFSKQIFALKRGQNYTLYTVYKKAEITCKKGEITSWGCTVIHKREQIRKQIGERKCKMIKKIEHSYCFFISYTCNLYILLRKKKKKIGGVDIVFETAPVAAIRQ